MVFGIFQNNPESGRAEGKGDERNKTDHDLEVGGSRVMRTGVVITTFPLFPTCLSVSALGSWKSNPQLAPDGVGTGREGSAVPAGQTVTADKSSVLA